MADLAIITEGQITKCPEGSRLPFIPTETKRIGGGGYSTVYKEVIASRHFIYDQNSASTLSNENPLPVARKWFPYTPDFDREYALLKHLKSARKYHERVIKYLAVVLLKHEDAVRFPSYTAKHNLLFPLADMDLEHFMAANELGRFDMAALLHECYNLADALDFLHTGIQDSHGEQISCCHMDIAPQNILVFDFNNYKNNHPVGLWRITDFSTSTLTTEKGASLLPPPKLTAGAHTAPEIHHKVENLSEKCCDIWSFGCILFEVLGAHFTCSNTGPVVSKWHFEKDPDGHNMHIAQDVSKHLMESRSDTRTVSLCKDLILDILRIEPAERPTMQIVRDRLSLLM